LKLENVVLDPPSRQLYLIDFESAVSTDEAKAEAGGLCRGRAKG
jgi:serine/threonine protein kinase